VSSIIGSTIGLVAFVGLLSRGFRSFSATSFGSDFYDVQARQLLHGHLWVPPAVASIEGIHSRGHTYIYFGPFLALLRLPFIAAFPGAVGHLSQASMLLGAIVLMAGTSLAAWTIRCSVRGREPLAISEQVAYGGFIATLCAGSVAFYLAGSPNVYYETELWGAALAICALAFFLRFALSSSIWAGAGLVVASLCDALTRQSVSIGPTALLAAAIVIAAWPAVASRRARRGGDPDQARPAEVEKLEVSRLAFLSGGLVLVVLLPAFVNWLKFRSLFSVPWVDQEIASISPTERAFFLHHGVGSLSNLSSVLSAYLRPIGVITTGLAPFFSVTGPVSVSGSSHFLGVAPTSSIPSSMPLLTLGSLLGVVLVIRPRIARWSLDARQRWALRLTAAGALLSGMVVLVFDTIANRYLADLLPLLVVLSLVALAGLLSWWPSIHLALRWVLGAMAIGLVGLSFLVNLSLGLQQGVLLTSSSTSASEASLLSTQFSIDRLLPWNFAISATTGTRPPSAPIPDELYAAPGCAGTYQWAFSSWANVELGAGGGRRILSIELPRSTRTLVEPLVVAGDPRVESSLQTFWIEDTPSGRYRLLYTSQPWDHFSGTALEPATSWFQVPADRTLTIDLAIPLRTAVASTAIEWAQIPGVVSFYPGLPVAPTTTLSVGGVPSGGSRFSGKMLEEPVPTPVCNDTVKAALSSAP
jgi:hypothetical protein